MDSVRKTFGGLTAVNNLSLEVPAGKITALIGPNGSGKTTAINLLTGVYTPNLGSIRFRGREIARLRPNRIASLGIGRTFQNIRLFDELTCLQNVLVGRHRFFRANLLDVILGTPRLKRQEGENTGRAMALLEAVGLAGMADRMPAGLPYGKRRSLEIARALAGEPELLCLDEPAAGMNFDEMEELQGLIHRVASGGTSILLVEHSMDLVGSVAENVIVLAHGEKLAEGSFEEVSRNPAVIEAYLGKGLAS